MSYHLCVVYVGCAWCKKFHSWPCPAFCDTTDPPLLNPWLSVVVCALVKYQLCATLKLFDKKSWSTIMGELIHRIETKILKVQYKPQYYSLVITFLPTAQ